MSYFLSAPVAGLPFRLSVFHAVACKQTFVRRFFLTVQPKPPIINKVDISL
jgi:hypothetical protein